MVGEFGNLKTGKGYILGILFMGSSKYFNQRGRHLGVGTFMDDCLNGNAFAFEIDDYIDKWHETKTDLPIYAFLGMTEEEYGLRVENDSFLKEILFARKNRISISDLINTWSKGQKLAARASSQEEAEAILDWLRRTNRIAE